MAEYTPNILTYNITALKGDSLFVVVSWKDATGAYLDLTGATGLGQIKLNKTDVEAIAEFTIELGKAANNIQYSLTPEQTEALGVGVWFYDIQLTFTADSSVRTFITGKLKIVQDVSG